jgi:nucleotide-binding universal stress UspA family protein
MKYNYELEPDEFAELMHTVRHVADVFASAVVTRAAHGRMGFGPVGAKPVDTVGAADDDTDCEAEADAAEAPATDPLPFRVVVNPPPEVPPVVSTPPMDEAAKRRAEEQRVRALHGKDQWITLVGVWRENFGVEGAPQPDRVRNLASVLNPDVIAYLRSTSGLTGAAREAIYLLDGGNPDALVTLSKAQLREARLIAENITQVASFHAPAIAEMLEYGYDYRTIPTED